MAGMNRPSVFSRCAAVTLLALVLAACAASPPPEPRPTAGTSVWVAKSAGTLQCDDAGIDVGLRASELRSLGVEPGASACGHDGRMRPAVCGAPDGRIVAFELRAGQLQAAARAGYMPLDAVAAARLGMCR